MKRFLLVAGLAALCAPMAHAAEIRMCERELRTAPLSEERNVHSALLQAVAIVNTSSLPEQLKSLRLELQHDAKVRDVRQLDATDIAAAVKQKPQISMLQQVFPFQLCNGTLLQGARLAASDVLQPGEAVVFMHQPFAWKGPRDQLLLVAETERGGSAQIAKFALPVVARTSATKALYPVAGRSFAAVSSSFHTPHRWASIEEFAYDILMVAGNGATHRGKGTKLADYAAFGKPVRAVADGRIVAAQDGMDDNAAMLKRVGETDEAYLHRLLSSQMDLIAKGMASVLGNHVVIDHGNGEYSMYAHLKKDSVKPKPGDAIKAGSVLGLLGSSGNSTEPHLHFQMCDGPDIATCRPMPATFIDYRLPFELAPRSILSGDIVETIR